MQKKVIFIFSTAYFPFIGGAEVALKEITDRISDFDFILFTAKMKRGLLKKEKMGNILVYRLGFGYSFDKILLPILAFIKFFQILISRRRTSRNKDLKPKAYSLEPVFWGMMASYGSIAAYFIKLVKPKLPFLLTLQEGDSEEHLKKGKFGLVGFFGGRIIRKADKIQAISNYLKDFAFRQGALSPIEIVPNGVNLNQNLNINPEYSGQNDNVKFKKNLNLKIEEKIIITTSRLVYKNGIDVLVKSIYELKNIVPKLKVKLLILGDGFLRKDLENLATELNLKNDVLFLGSVPPNEVFNYLTASDLFVRPSRSEGLGNSFLEAMAAGIPVIGTDVGGIPDFLIDPSTNSGQATGLFCEVDNPKDLAKKIKLILENEKLREKIIQNAKKLVYEKYDWENIAKKINLLFKDFSQAKFKKFLVGTK